MMLHQLMLTRAHDLRQLSHAPMKFCQGWYSTQANPGALAAHLILPSFARLLPISAWDTSSPGVSIRRRGIPSKSPRYMLMPSRPSPTGTRLRRSEGCRALAWNL